MNFRVFLFRAALLLLPLPVLAQNYLYSTFAGNPSAAGVVDGTGSAVRFNVPAGVAVNSAGEIFVTDQNAAVLRKISPAGEVTTVASIGNPGAGIAFDSAGNAYVADPTGHVIRKVTTAGVVTIFAGQVSVAGNSDGILSVARFNNPQGLAFDAAGNLLVTDSNNHTIRKVTPAGTVSTLAGLAGVSGNVDGPAPLARFSFPKGIVVVAGAVFVADSSNARIRRIGADGLVSTFAGSSNNYYYSTSYDGEGANARFSNPSFIAADSAGVLYVTEQYGPVIRRVTPQAVVTTIGGQFNTSGMVNGLDLNSRFNGPLGVAVNAGGDLFIADSNNRVIRQGTLIAAPTVTVQPVDRSITVGASTTFGVTAASPSALSYQWQRQPVGTVGFQSIVDAGPYSGALTATLSVASVTAAMNGDQFRCVISNASTTTIASSIVTLTVTSAPAFTSSNNATFYASIAGTFMVRAAGFPVPSYAVTSGSLPSWATLDAATGVISGTPSSTAGSPFSFVVTASNGISPAATQAVTLTVQPIPTPSAVVITSTIQQVVAVGQPATFAASYSGSGPLTLQWKRNGQPIAGATNGALTIGSVSARDNGYYQLTVTGPAGTVTSRAAFLNVSYGRSEVVGWGIDSSIPSGLTTVTAVAAGASHGLALKADGTVTAWGTNSDGQATVPSGLSNVVAVAAGNLHSLALKADGTVVAWGYNGSGQCNVPSGLSNVVAIAAGQYHSLALKGDGTVVAWGGGSSGEAAVPAGLSNVVAVAGGGNYSVALKADGSTVLWGYLGGYQPPANWGNIVAIAGGSYAILGLKADGSVLIWGSTSFLSNMPTGLTNVSAVALSYYQAVALKLDGTVVVWGDNYNTSVPLPGNLRSVVAISAGNSLRLALRDASNDLAPSLTTSPVSVSANNGQSVTFNAAAGAGTAGVAFQWYRNGTAIPGATTANYSVLANAANAGSYHVVATNSLGSSTSGVATLTINTTPTLSATAGGRFPIPVGGNLTLSLSSSITSSATVQWRRNGRAISGATDRSYTIANATLADGGYYQASYDAGSGATLTATAFVPVTPSATEIVAIPSSGYLPSNLTDVYQIDSYESSSVAVKADGTIVQWTTSGTPTQSGLINVVQAEVGGSWNFALLGDGSVTAWSASSYYSSPSIQPGILTGIVQIAAGQDHVVALRADGTLAAWGVSSAATAAPSSINDAVAVAAGYGFGLALRANGTVVGWGRNDYGQSSPPSSLTNVVAIAAGPSAAAAVRSDGTVVTWGYGVPGSLAAPAGLTGLTKIAVGTAYAYAIQADGGVQGWGSYASYPYGQVPAVLHRQVFGVTAAANLSLYLRDATADTVPVITTHPTGTTVYAGQSAALTVAASGGTALLRYQWRRNGEAISGATNSTLLLPYAVSATAGTYDVVVTDHLGATTSNAAALTFNSAAGVATTPTGRRAIAAGQNLTLNGSTVLTGPVTYQWYHDGRPVSGATTATLALTNATWRTGGAYRLVVANSASQAISTPVYVSVASGAQVVAWGSNSYNLTSIPSAAQTNPVMVASSGGHALVLRSDGTVIAWGNNQSHQCDVPSDIGNAVAVAAGAGFSMALLADGTVRTWGGLNFTPSAVGPAVAIAANGASSYAMAIRADGSVVVWSTDGLRTDVPNLSRVMAGAISNSCGLALLDDGTVVQWGSGGAPLPAGLSGIVAVAAGPDYNLALKANGSVVAWGSNYYGTTAVPAGLTQVDALAAGNYTAFAVKSTGQVEAWGGQNYPELSNGAARLAPAYQVAASDYVAFALRDPSGDSAPNITTISADQTITDGQPLTLAVTASGVPAASYQWYWNGQLLSGATTAAYYVPSTYAGTAGSYTVAVTNALGTVVSGPISISIRPAGGTPGLSVSAVRANAGSGAIYGSFTVEGTQSKTMLIRGIGPSLAGFAVPNVMADPKLVITNATGTIVASNDNWSSAPNEWQVTTASATLGAFALTTGSKDAAVVAVFAPGTYHVSLLPATGVSGNALLEIYDADTRPRLVYAATLGPVSAGAGVLVQGLTIKTPPLDRSYLIRGLGPALGVSEALAHPQVAVFDSTGSQIAANAGWADDAALATAATTAGAQSLAAGSADAALLFTPSGAGVFTIQLKGTANEAGIALLEVHEVDPQRATNIAPAVVVPPLPRSVVSGQSVTLGAVSIGKPAPTLQWRRNGVAIAGATGHTLVLTNIQTNDAGNYTVTATNSAGTATSQSAALTIVSGTATHAAASGYVPGSTVTISNTLTYTGSAASLGWQVTLPAGWSFASASGAVGDVAPAVGATGNLEWAWSNPPPSPVVFSYTVNVPAGETGPKNLSASAIVRVGGVSENATVSPALLSVDAAPTLHAADTNGDGKISLIELTRVIELYNTRNGTVRTGCYNLQSGTEDGFAPEPTRASGTTATLASYHAADSNHDGKISLIELTRVIELYNYRSGTTRTGQYHVQTGTEDGFAPGP